MSSKRNAILPAALVAVCAVSAVLACFKWVNDGICTDSVLLTAIAVLSLICLLVLWRSARACREAERLLDRPIVLKMVSGPVNTASEQEEPIVGKMPHQKSF